MNTTRTRDIPGVITFPPLIFAACLGAGFGLDWVWPLELPIPWVARASAGGLLLVAAAVFGIGGERALHGAGTNVRPDRPTTAIVTGGIYRYTRNPLYMAMLCLYAGISLIAGQVWPFVMWIVLLPVLTVGVIEREERYLAAKFGQPYLTYKARVRRWL